MATDYQAIMLALARGDSWATITHNHGCSRRTIDKASKVIRTQGLDATAITALSTHDIATLFPDNRLRHDEDYLQPNFTAIAQRQARGKRVTLKVEHERYSRQPVTPGQLHYSYKQFCKLYDHYVDVNDLTAQLTHLPGDHMFVDWSGDCMTVVDPLTGIRSVANIFVASLPHSGMIFAVATPDMKMRAWLSSHQDAFDYFGGRPMKITPDNASTATNQLFKGGSLRDVNAEYFRFSQHFGVGITPARPLKPRDKAHVEKAVDIVQTWVIEYLDDREFYTFEELNTAVATQVDWINDRQGFRGKNISRRQLFLSEEFPMLNSSPIARWSWSTWRRAKAGINYHIRFKKHFYSVPWQYAGRFVDVQIFDDHLTVYADNQIIATHALKPANMGYSTVDEHVPEKHKDLATKWNRERIEGWAASIGAATQELISQMFHARKVEAQAYSSTFAVLSVAKKHSRAQLDAACRSLLDRHEVPSVRKVAEEIQDLAREQTTLFADTQLPLPTNPSPRPQQSLDLRSSHVRGKQAFVFREEK